MARRTMILVLGLMLISTLAVAGDFYMKGPGAYSCAKFGQDYRRDPDLMENVYFAWAWGFMSGLNAEHTSRGERFWNLGDRSLEDQKRFLRRWCDDHPLAHYFEAVFELIKTLSLSNEEPPKEAAPPRPTTR